METIKNAIGLGTAPQEGREPVSGVSGAGTAAEPYDQGNVETSTLGGNAPQHTDPSTDHSTTSNVASTADPTQDRSTTNALSSISGASATPATAGKSKDTPSNVATTATAEPQATQAPEPTSEQPAKTGGIGSSSWFSTAIPFIGKGKTTESSDANSTSIPTASTTTEQPQQQQSNPKSEQPAVHHTSLEDIRSQPANQLPTAVPTGHSTDLAPSDSIPSTDAAASVGTAGAASTTNTADPMHAHQDIPSEPATGGIGRNSGPPSHSLIGSKGSIAPEAPDHANAPLKPAAKGGEHGVNPSAVPTAGGKKLGEDAYTERQSMSADSTGAGLPTETSANTARNVGTAAPDVSGASATTTGSGSGAGLEKETSPSESSPSNSSGHKKKHGLVEKIKEKVHKH